MGNALEIKGRISSVKNISQVTRALEAVSASRVRRAQDAVESTRNYAEKAWEILLNLQSTAQGGTALHPLLTQRDEVKKRRVILITSDRGLAGAFNSNIIRVAQRFAAKSEVPVDFVTVGRKGRDSMIRNEEDVDAEFSNMPAEPSVADIKPVARAAIDDFLSGTVDEVFIAYTDFVNTLTQRPVIQRLLPLVPYETDDQALNEYVKDVPDISSGITEYEFEPNPTAVLDEVVPRFTELQLYQAVLESLASEHAARMVAMKNASDNASELVDDLTLDYNKARQTEVTNEILDIVGGAEALAESVSKQSKAKKDRNAATGDNGKRKAPAAEKLSAPPPAPEKPELEVTDAPVFVPAEDSDAGAGEPDDLTAIEGIGPTYSKVLTAAGIDTFEKLAGSSEDDLRAAIEAAGSRVPASVATWAEQAVLARDGKWEELETLQDDLKGGRRV
jgi:F-type H+-transporting ATPase subunit gamma